MKGQLPLFALALLLLGGCATPGSDIHLEPLFARFAAADGAVETEALFGLYHRRAGGKRLRHTETTPAETTTTLGPLWSLDHQPDEAVDWRSRFLVPLGSAKQRGEERQFQLIPLVIWQKGPKADGSTETLLMTGWGWVFRSSNKSGTSFGWFPFYGDLEDFIVFDRLQFLMWPLWTYTEGGGSQGRHVLFPVFGWTTGEGKQGFRVWPLYGQAKREGNFERRFFLWPIFHHHKNRLSTPTPETKWMMFPLLGRTKAGSFAATTFLWPLFGYSADSEGGFWSLDFPWPLVRLQRGPGDLSRTRFWPLFSHLEAGSLDAWNFLWPFIHVRKEDYRRKKRDSLYVIPFWQSWKMENKETGEKATWRKALPLFQHETRGAWSRGSFPTLDPFQRNTHIDRHYAWLWKLWEWESEGERLHGRAWGGLSHHEKTAEESRTTVSFLWSNRRTASGSCSEHSILFGLLRWRVTEEGGFDMLRPAFPGPGWPSDWEQTSPAPAPRLGS